MRRSAVAPEEPQRKQPFNPIACLRWLSDSSPPSHLSMLRRGRSSMPATAAAYANRVSKALILDGLCLHVLSSFQRTGLAGGPPANREHSTPPLRRQPPRGEPFKCTSTACHVSTICTEPVQNYGFDGETRGLGPARPRSARTAGQLESILPYSGLGGDAPAELTLAPPSADPNDAPGSPRSDWRGRVQAVPRSSGGRSQTTRRPWIRQPPRSTHFTASGKMRCSATRTRAASVSRESPGSTGTAACHTIGPASSSGVTKCTVAPVTVTPCAIACPWASTPGNAGSNEG